MTLRDHLLSAEKQTGVTPEQLQDHDCPDLMNYIWEWFCELNAGRSSGSMGMMPISYSEIQAWSAITGNELNQFEYRAIRLLDSLLIGNRNG